MKLYKINFSDLYSKQWIVFKGQTAKKASFGPILERYNPKTFRIVISRSFLKGSAIYVSFSVKQNTEQFKSKLNGDRSIWLPKQFQIKMSSFKLKSLWSFWLL